MSHQDLSPVARPGTHATVAVIVVNYGTADLAVDAVESVRAHGHGGRSVEIHLVDNASPGNDAARFRDVHEARDWGSDVTLWCERENHGFGRGNNVVMAALSARDDPPEFVFLLNPDARLENEAIAILADFLDAHSEVAIAGAALLRPGGQRVSSAFRFPGMASEFERAAAFGPISRRLARWRSALEPELVEPRRVDWVSGAAFLARFADLAEVGFFDPAFFLYFEEIDLMARVTQGGGEVWTVPEARVAHVAGAATGMVGGVSRKDRLPGYWFESWRIFFSKRHGRARASAIAVARLSGCAIDRTTSALRRRSPATPPHFISDFLRYVLKPLVTGRY